MDHEGGLTRCSWSPAFMPGAEEPEEVAGGEGEPERLAMPCQNSDDPVLVKKSGLMNHGNGREDKTRTTAALVQRRLRDPKGGQARRSGEPVNQVGGKGIRRAGDEEQKTRQGHTERPMAR